MSFPGLIGHRAIQEVLLRMLTGGRLPHALLFVGSEGAGKTTMARALAQALLSHKGDLALHPDFFTLSQMSVDQVRELTGRLGMSSLSGGAKVVFLEEASSLSMGAVNALLKTLEEPKGNTYFILRARSIDELPATIVSRCQTFRFGMVRQGEIIDGLVKMGFVKGDAQAAATQSLGRPGRAIRFLKESSYQAELTTGLNQAVAFLDASLPGRLGQIMELIPKTETEKEETLVKLLDQWELVFRDVILRQLGLASWQVFTSEPLDRLARATTMKSLLSTFTALHEVRSAIDHHVNSHLALEHLALTNI